MAIKKEVALTTIEKAKTTLAGLPDKTPAGKPVDAALLDLKPTIEGLLGRGYPNRRKASAFRPGI